MSQRPTRKKTTSKRKQTAKPDGQTSKSNEAAAKRASRKEVAQAEAKKKKQLQMIIGGVAIALVVAVVAIFFNRPSANGVQIDYTDIETAPSGIIQNVGTPIASPSADDPALAATGFTVGNPDAPVTMHIYEDFQCHFCKDFHDTQLPKVVEDFVKTGQIKLVFHDYAFLGTNPEIANPDDVTIELRDPDNESAHAAEAAMCAGEQDSYLKMVDKLYGNYGGVQQGAFKRANLNRFADDMGLDMDQFNDCMDSQKYIPALAESRTNGQANGVSSTPTFILDNGSGELNVVPNNGDYNLLKKTIQASIDTAP